MMYKSELLEDSDIQLIDGDRGKNYPKEADFRKDGHCLFLSAKNVTSSGFEFSQTSFIDVEKDEVLRAGKLQRGDIVVTTRGTIGNVAFYGDDIPFDHIRINSGMMIFRADEQRWNRRFLYFLLTSQYIQKQVESLTSGSAVPQLPARDLKKFELPDIPKDIQDSIEKIVGDLTDKIKLNRQTNQTLEHIAQAIFKSWFVDFDPTRAKVAALQAGQDPERAAMAVISGRSVAELEQLPLKTQTQLKATAALFPDMLVDSELGGIPEGWDTVTLEDIIELAYGKALKKTDRIEGEFPVYGSGGLTGTHNKALVEGPGIIVGRKGTVGALYWEDDSFFPIDTVFYVKCKKDTTLVYTYYLLQTLGLEDMNTDAAVPGLNRNNAYRLEVVKPSVDLVISFSSLIDGFRDKLLMNKQETISLERIRDSLLLKLLAGDLEIDKVA